MRIGSLFSGAGGLDLAVEEVFGGRVVWQAEVDEAASKVLAHRFPGVPNLGDVTAVDWARIERVDVICAGFPCQDVSTAGLRAGLKSGTRTGLFLSVMDAVRAIRPRYVVLENVLGLLSADGDAWPDEVIALDVEWRRWSRIRGLIDHKKAKAERKGNRGRNWWHRKEAEGVRAARRERVAFQEFRRERLRLVPRAIETVLRSLAEVGLDAAWHCLRASDVGAPHQRERIFIVATPADADDRAGDGEWSRPQPRQRGEAAADAAGVGWDEGWPESARLVGGPDAAERCDGHVALLSTPNAQDGNGGGRFNSAGHQSTLPGTVRELLPTPSAADGGGGHLTRSGDRSGELLLPGVARAAATGALLPTPRASRGASTTEVAYALGGERSNGDRRQGEVLLPTPTARDHKGPNQRQDESCLHGALLPTHAASDATGGGRHPDARKGHTSQIIDTALLHGTPAWGKYGSAIARWESLTRPAPSPTEPNSKGNPRLAAAFPEWMMGWPLGWVTDPAIGISRNDQLRIVGNGVCPHQAAHGLRLLVNIATAPLGVTA